MWKINIWTIKIRCYNIIGAGDLMKKILLLLLTLFLVTGCESANNTVNKIDVDKIFNTFLSK